MPSRVLSQRRAARIEKRFQRVKDAAVFVTMAVAIVAATTREDPTLRHPRLLHGEQEVHLMLNGHPGITHSHLRMSAPSFYYLVKWLEVRAGLRPSKTIGTEEKVVIFMMIVCQGQSTSVVCASFNHSFRTVNWAFHEVLNCLLVLARDRIKMPTAEEVSKVSKYISTKRDLFPYFDDAIGAIDGTHFIARPPEGPHGDQTIWYNYNKDKSMNCLFVVDFDGRIRYVFAGTEGSANDKQLFEFARERGHLDLAHGKFLVADGGFAMGRGLIVPWQKVRFHIREWDEAGVKPKNMKELYNKRHSSLRMIVERVIGVLREKFRILTDKPRLHPKVQTKVVIAVSALYNFTIDCGDLTLCKEDFEWTERLPESTVNDAYEERVRDHPEMEGVIDGIDAWSKRQHIAQEMFADYGIRSGLATGRAIGWRKGS